MEITRQEAAFGIAVINRTSKLLAAAVRLGKDGIIRDALDEEINYAQLASSIISYVKEDPDPLLFEQLMVLADTESMREYLSTHRSGALALRVREVADATDRLVAFGTELFRKGEGEYANLVPFFANPQAKALFDRAVNAGLLKKDYQPAPGVNRFQLKLIAIAIHTIMDFSYRDKWYHFAEQWGDDVHRATIPFTKGVAIGQVAHVYPEVPLWDKVIPENGGKAFKTDFSEAQAKALFTGLMRKGYLGHHTALESFLSIMGMGQAAFTPINWIDRGYNSLIYFVKEAFGALNPDYLLRICDCFTCNGKQITHSSLKTRSSYVYRNKDKWDFVPVIDDIIAKARKK